MNDIDRKKLFNKMQELRNNNYLNLSPKMIVSVDYLLFGDIAEVKLYENMDKNTELFVAKQVAKVFSYNRDVRNRLSLFFEGEYADLPEKIDDFMDFIRLYSSRIYAKLEYMGDKMKTFVEPEDIPWYYSSVTCQSKYKEYYLEPVSNSSTSGYYQNHIFLSMKKLLDELQKNGLEIRLSNELTGFTPHVVTDTIFSSDFIFGYDHLRFIEYEDSITTFIVSNSKENELEKEKGHQLKKVK